MLIKRKHHKLIVWYKPKKNEYYIRLVSGYYQDYFIGKINIYGHQIVHIEEIEFFKHHISFKVRFIRKLIRLLERIERG